jgi:hypothetical protein
MKATTPDYGEKGHAGAGATVGGLTGLALVAIADPLGLLFWGPWVRRVARSALILLAEPSTADDYFAAATVALPIVTWTTTVGDADARRPASQR